MSKRLVFEIDVEGSALPNHEVKITPFIVPLTTDEEVLWAEALIAKFDKADSHPNDGVAEVDGMEKVNPRINIFGLHVSPAVSVPYAIKVFIEEVPDAAKATN